jgi:hypothetical protein
MCKEILPRRLGGAQQVIAGIEEDQLAVRDQRGQLDCLRRRHPNIVAGVENERRAFHPVGDIRHVDTSELV